MIDSPSLQNLQSFSLYSNRITDKGAKALARSSFLQHCRTLVLCSNRITDKGTRALSRSPSLASLQHLDLSSNRIRAEGAKDLASSPHLASLCTLDLSDNQIADEGIKALAFSPSLASLHRLDLSNNPIGDEGAFALAGSPHLRHLSDLSLWGNEMTDSGVLALASSPSLARLHEICTHDDHEVTEIMEKAFDKRADAKQSPDVRFKKERTLVWKLFAYACLSEETKVSVRSEFLILARRLFQADRAAQGWLWCEAHLLTWAGEAFQQVLDTFPEVAAFRERRDAMLDLQRSLEGALYEPF